MELFWQSIYIYCTCVTGGIEPGSSEFGVDMFGRPTDTYNDFWYIIVCYVYVDSMFVSGGGGGAFHSP